METLHDVPIGGKNELSPEKVEPIPQWLHAPAPSSSKKAGEGNNNYKDKYNNMMLTHDEFGITQRIFKLFISFICGVIFGFLLEKSRVFEPDLIRRQLAFNSTIMLKMFLTASAFSLISLSVLSMIPATRPAYQRAWDDYFARFQVDKGLFAVIIGTTLLGVGMALCGACPGMVLVQVGAGLQHATLTLCGCLWGAFMYGMLEPIISDVFSNDRILRQHSLTLSKLFNTPLFILGIPMAVIILAFVFALEAMWNWTVEVYNPPAHGTFLSMRSWPPYVCGAGVGLLQIPIVLFVDNTLGSSSSYCTAVSQVIRGPFANLSPYLRGFQSGIGNWWQVVYVCGAILGGFLSSTSSGFRSHGVYGVSTISAVCGGLIMILGARLAGGCTSGHGISGMGFLSTLSILGIACMFAGGYVMSFLMVALHF